jgi:hypothetical protein
MARDFVEDGNKSVFDCSGMKDGRVVANVLTQAITRHPGCILEFRVLYRIKFDAHTTLRSIRCCRIPWFELQ